MRNGLVLALLLCTSAALADTPLIKPAPGLVLTTAVHATLQSAAIGTVDNLDMEHLVSLSSVGADGLTYSITMNAPANVRAAEELKKWKVTRIVRREDLEQSARMTLLYSTADPQSYGGQTFAETSARVLNAIKSTGESPFVFGIYGAKRKGEPLLPPLPPQPAAGETQKTGTPAIPDMGRLLSMAFEGSRYYYRGTLRRVEPGSVPFSVLLNGVRTNLQAVHAAGTFSAGADYEPEHVEIWWLDNPAYPLNLKWVFGRTTALVTRVDLPTDDGGGGGGAGGGAGTSMAAQLAGKSCRVELHGIYFNTGSAVLLEESEPMLKRVAALIKASSDTTLTIEGHTDNIGSAQYNQTLSEQRAEAVRQALVARYAVPPTRLSAKGYGLTRPVETNGTFEGRAHNRRVELARPCAGAH